MAEQVSSENYDGAQESLATLRASFEFSTKTWREDMTLVVEDEKLFVASNILALVSPVFQVRFEEVFTEGLPRELVLEDHAYDDIVEFLRCVYPNILKPISQENVSKMLPLAEEYKVQSLTDRCEKFLISVSTEVSRSAELYQNLMHASNFELKDLEQKCVEMISKLHHNIIRREEQTYPIPDAIKLKIREKVIDRLTTQVIT